MMVNKTKSSLMELEKVKAKVAQSYPTFCDPKDCSCQAPLSVGFSQQEYWSGLLQGIKPGSPALRADSLLSDHQGSLPVEFIFT